MTKNRIEEILNLLEIEYLDADCALHHDNVYQLIVAVALSAQTTDKSVNKVTPELFLKYPTPEALAEAKQEDVEILLKSIGMYRTKAANIINMAKMLCEQYDSQVPESDKELVKLPGVGRKTANVVMSVGFGHQRIAVDTHVFRVANRIGLAKGKNVVETEKDLMKNIPKERWTKTHHSLIFHGRNCCSARKPNCQGCVIGHLCEKNNVEQ